MTWDSWGVSWLGSWGNSWGPLHEVAETWDTDQGIARNLANNLKWERISDGEAKFPPVRTRSGAGTLSASGNAYAKFGVVRTQSGLGAWGFSVEANGFASFRRVGVKTGVNATATGNGFTTARVRAEMRTRALDISVSGEGGALFTPVRVRAEAVKVLSARGIRNPTDEELLIFAGKLLTSKQKHDNFRTP